MTTQLLLTVATLGLALLLYTDVIRVWHLFLFGVISGTVWSFNQPARQALVPNLVPREDLMNAFALNSAAFNTMRIAGPAVGGFLIAGVGYAGNFFIQTATYVGVLAMLAMMAVPPRSPLPRQFSVRANLVEGLTYVRHHEVVLALVLLGLIPAFFVFPMMAILPIFAKDVLGIGPDGLGMLMSAMGAGALSATLVLASLGDFRHRGALILGTAVCVGLALTMFSRSTWLPFSLAFLVVLGASHQSYLLTTNTTLQTIVPDALRGRVVSIYMLDHGLTPLGSLLAGVGAALLGAPLAVTIMGACVTALAIAAIVRLPAIRRLT